MRGWSGQDRSNRTRTAPRPLARQLAQTIIADVNTDPGLAPHRDIAAASGFRAVHSTPLVDLRGHLVDVLSTHYPFPYQPPAGDLELMKRFGILVGQAVEACLEADGQLIGDELSLEAV